MFRGEGNTSNKFYKFGDIKDRKGVKVLKNTITAEIIVSGKSGGVCFTLEDIKGVIEGTAPAINYGLEEKIERQIVIGTAVDQWTKEELIEIVQAYEPDYGKKKVGRPKKDDLPDSE